MITMIVLVTIMAISRNVVSATHRNSHKHRNSYSNRINDIPLNFEEAFAAYNMDNGNTDAYSNTLSLGSTNLLDNVGSNVLSGTATSIDEDGLESELIPSGSLQKLEGSNLNSIDLPEEAHNGSPYFDLAASKNVTALLGKTAYLNCRVKNLGNKTMLLQVSWVRHRDIHLLTVGRYTYTSDQRFRAIHQPQTEDWILQIKYTQHRDSGIYECQVSTTPHMSHYIHLNVVEPSTEIIGSPDLYIESGSTINLTCVILNSPEPPAYIFWNHNNAQIINYDSPRGGVSVVTLKGDITTSFLLIKSARSSDSGHYQCNPSNAKPKSVTVHVLNGASHSVSRGVPSSNAARGNRATSTTASTNALCMCVIILIHIGMQQTLYATTNALIWCHHQLNPLLLKLNSTRKRSTLLMKVGFHESGEVSAERWADKFYQQQAQFEIRSRALQTFENELKLR